MIKPAPGGETAIEGTLAGMAERRVAQVVGQRQRLRQILVKPKRASQGTGNLGDLQRMGQARAEMIPFVKDEDLSLVCEPPERGRMDDTIAVPAKGIAGRAHRLRMEPAAAPGRSGRIRRTCDCHLNRHPETSNRPRPS